MKQEQRRTNFLIWAWTVRNTHSSTPDPKLLFVKAGTCCRMEEDVVAAEDAVSALGKLIEYQAAVRGEQQGEHLQTAGCVHCL